MADNKKINETYPVGMSEGLSRRDSFGTSEDQHSDSDYNQNVNYSKFKANRSFIRTNIVGITTFLVTVLFYLGMYYGVFRSQLEAKPDEFRVREIIREEIQSKFSLTDGEVLKANFHNLNAKVDRAIFLIEQYIYHSKSNGTQK